LESGRPSLFKKEVEEKGKEKDKHKDSELAILSERNCVE